MSAVFIAFKSAVPTSAITLTTLLHQNIALLGAEDLFRQHGVELVVMDDAECIQMMREFIQAHPDLWNEDIGR